MNSTARKNEEEGYGVIEGFRISEREAQIVGQLVDDLTRQNGRPPSGAELLEVARSKDCPAHEIIFDKPLKKAAEDYYLKRAQYLVRGIRVTYVPSTTKLPRISGTISMPAVTVKQVYSFPDGTGGREQVHGREVIRDPQWRQRVLDNFEGRIRAIRREASGFVSVCDALDNVLEVIQVEQQRIRLDPPHGKSKRKRGSVKARADKAKKTASKQKGR